MKHPITTRTAIAGLVALAAPFSPALADGKAATPYQLAQMMRNQGAAAPGAMPGGMMDDKMGAMPPAAPGPAAAPAAGMAPAQQPVAPAVGMAPGGMMDDKMGIPPAAAAMPGMPAAGAPPAAGMAGPGGMMPMPPAMMSMMSSMMGMAKMQPPAAPLDRVEGRIAFIRAELGVTDAQAPAFDQFAQALRTARGHLTEAGQALSASHNGQSGSPSRLEAYERHLSMRLDSLRGARESYQRLYATLSPAQKQTADELVTPLLASF